MNEVRHVPVSAVVDGLIQDMMDEGRAYRRLGLGLDKMPPYKFDEWVAAWKQGWDEEDRATPPPPAPVEAQEYRGRLEELPPSPTALRIKELQRQLEQIGIAVESALGLIRALEEEGR